MALPLNIEFSASYLDGVMEHEPAEIRRQWEIVRRHITSHGDVTEALGDVIAERASHAERRGWTPEHDDEHGDGSLALAAALYASPITLTDEHGVDPWPWKSAPAEDGSTVNDGDGRGRHDERRRLVIAGALILAEIERLDRASRRAESEPAREPVHG